MPDHDNKYIKTKVNAYSNKINTDFHILGVSKDEVECNCVTIASIDFVYLQEKTLLGSIFSKCVYKTLKKQMMGYLGYNFMIKISLNETLIPNLELSRKTFIFILI